MTSILQILSGTPTWVYILFALLIYLGIKASKTRVISVKKLCILPIVFTYMSVHTLLISFAINTISVSTWVIATAIGIILGWIQVARYKLEVDKAHFLVKVPGTWSVLILIILIFVTKYYFGFELASDPQLKLHLGFELSMLFVSGALTGLFVGKLGCFLYRLYTEAQTDLR